MNTLKVIGFGALFVFFCIHAAAQQKPDTIVHLQEVVIEQSRLNTYAIGHYTLEVDSLTHQLSRIGSVADLMRKFGFGHVRSYGPSGIATPSFRGTGASHTNILWNGINLQSPLNGQSDFTLIPVSLIDEAFVLTGGSASLYGSGAIGGTIHLNSKAKFNQGLDLGVSGSAGSFGNYFNDLTAAWSGKKFTSSTKLFRIAAENNFSFVNKNKNPTAREKRDHSAINQYGILQQNYWQFLANHLLSFRTWYQNNDVEVPNPTTVSRKTKATQRDEFYRSMLAWQFDRGEFHISWQASHVRHLLDYRDPLTSQISKSLFNSYVNNLESSVKINSEFEATGSINHTLEKAEAEEFGSDNPQRNRVALFGALKLDNGKKWKSSFSLRQELVNGNATPLASSIGSELKLSEQIKLSGNISKSYRIPTFNDLYWRGSGATGNPDLRSESSWSEEIAVHYNSREKSTSLFSGHVSIFSNQVDNWILWTPTTTLGWTPLNIKKVWSRGIESNFTARSKFSSVSTEVQLVYSFTKSTNEEIYADGNVNELGKQLPFTPQHEGSATLRVEWKKINLNLVHSYTGKQFTDSDNSEFFAMKNYHVPSAWLSREFSFNKIRASCMFEVNNILNRPYESRPGYPMPGRNFKIALSIHFNKPNQS